MTCTLGGAAAGIVRAQPPAVWIALSQNGGAYTEAASAVAAELERGGPSPPEIVTRHWQALPLASQHPRMVITVGTAALSGLLDSGLRAPILAVLVPESTFRQLLSGRKDYGAPASAVVLDQPPSRQLRALRMALPDRQRVGILFGPESQRLASLFQLAAEGAGVHLATGLAESAGGVGGALQSVMEDSDILLAVPDPAVFNNENVRNVMMSAYRRRLPVAGFSPAYVTAGALLAIYSTPAQLGRQAGEIARGFLAGRSLPPVQAPREFRLGVNEEVARSLGIRLNAEDAAALAKRLAAAERKP